MFNNVGRVLRQHNVDTGIIDLVRGQLYRETQYRKDAVAPNGVIDSIMLLCCNGWVGGRERWLPNLYGYWLMLTLFFKSRKQQELHYPVRFGVFNLSASIHILGCVYLIYHKSIFLVTIL